MIDLRVLDGDGNEYQFLTINGNDWLIDNLKTTSFNDSTDIPNITDAGGWSSANEAAYCWYGNNLSNKNNYGGLYNWYAINSGKICPKGWRVASDQDWISLTDFVGNDPGFELEKLGLNFPKGGARTSSGFFGSATLGDLWWTSTSNNSETAYYRLRYGGAIVRDNYFYSHGMSCRCLRKSE